MGVSQNFEEDVCPSHSKHEVSTPWVKSPIQIEEPLTSKVKSFKSECKVPNSPSEVLSSSVRVQNFLKSSFNSELKIFDLPDIFLRELLLVEGSKVERKSESGYGIITSAGRVPCSGKRECEDKLGLLP